MTMLQFLLDYKNQLKSKVMESAINYPDLFSNAGISYERMIEIRNMLMFMPDSIFNPENVTERRSLLQRISDFCKLKANEMQVISRILIETYNFN